MNSIMWDDRNIYRIRKDEINKSHLTYIRQDTVGGRQVY